MLLATDWARYGLPPAPIRNACALSGLFDLEPLRRSYLNADLRMDEETTRRNSPIHHLPDTAPELIVAVGGGETDEFRRQSRSFTDAWLDRGLPGEYLEVLDLDHVNVSAEYQRLASPLTPRDLRADGPRPRLARTPRAPPTTPDPDPQEEE